jgi:hypothetical protein
VTPPPRLETPDWVVVMAALSAGLSLAGQFVWLS